MLNDRTSQAERPRVSVVIPTFGRPTKLVRAVASVLDQTMEDFELLIVDDNDPESQAAKQTQSQIRSRWGNRRNVFHLKHHKNRGACAARNTGIKAAKGEYIAFLDDDDRWEPRFLESLVSALERTHERVTVAYAGHKVELASYNLQIIAQSHGHTGSVLQQLFEGWCPASTSLFMVARETFEKCGGFDESLSSFQDYDMWLRLAAETEFVHVDERLAIKHQGEGFQLSIDPETRLRGFEQFFRKWEMTFRAHIDEQRLDALKEKFRTRIARTEYLQYLEDSNYFKAVGKLSYLCTTSHLTLQTKLGLVSALLLGTRRYNFLMGEWLRLRIPEVERQP